MKTQHKDRAIALSLEAAVLIGAAIAYVIVAITFVVKQVHRLLSLDIELITSTIFLVVAFSLLGGAIAIKLLT
jgi:hypothetical protein